MKLNWPLATVITAGIVAVSAGYFTANEFTRGLMVGFFIFVGVASVIGAITFLIMVAQLRYNREKRERSAPTVAYPYFQPPQDSPFYEVVDPNPQESFAITPVKKDAQYEDW